MVAVEALTADFALRIVLLSAVVELSSWCISPDAEVARP
jgi:hypothetical protein